MINKKLIINYIKKHAQSSGVAPPGPSSGGPTGATGTTGGGVAPPGPSSGGPTGATGAPAPSPPAPAKSTGKATAPATDHVKEMQAAMQEFVGKVFPEYAKTSGRSSRYMSEYGIGSFLTSHYGGSYERFSNIQTPEAKQAAEDIEALLLSMKQIGGRIAFTSPDGLWGKRTQQSIRNISNLSSAILDFAQAIDFDDRSFTRSDREALQKEIPPSENPLKDKFPNLQTKAQKIKEILDKLNTFTDNFQEHLTKGYEGQFKKDTGTESEVQTFKEIKLPEAKITLDPTEKQMLDDFNSTFNVNVPDTGKIVNISFKEGYDAIVKKLKAQDLDDKWISKNFANFINNARRQIIASLKANKRIQEKDQYELIKEISIKISDCEKLVKQITEIAPNQLNQKSYTDLMTQFLNSLKTNLSKNINNVDNLKALKNTIDIIYGQLVEKINKFRMQS